MKDLIITSFLTFCFALTLHSQKAEQGSNLTGRQVAGIGKHLCATGSMSYEEYIKDKGKFELRQKNNVMTQLPMRVHIVREDNGSGGVSLEVINKEVANLNYALFSEQIEYFIADINYINDSNNYDWVKSNQTVENNFCGPHEVDDAVNVFWVNSITTSSGGSACGYAYYPCNSDVCLRVFMRNSCGGGVWWDTFVHEFGHHLDLPHTHNGTSNGNTHSNAEHVPRSGPESNCSTDGDFICDTQADPTGATSNCVYNEGETDVYGNTYTPDEDNVMSYYADACGGALFTPGQYSRINSGVSERLNHSAYDIDGASPNTVTDPSNLTAVNSAGNVILNWTDNSGNETGFLIERSEDGTNFEPIPYLGVGPNVTSKADGFELYPSTTYWYRVKASNDNPDHYSNIVSITTNGSTTNYTCFTAFTIDGCNTYTTSGPSQGNGASYTGRNAVWYIFTPTSEGTLDVYSCDGGVDTNLKIHSGICGNLNLVAENDDSCEMYSGSQLYASEILDISISQGATYYIEWDSRWSSAGFDFTFCFTPESNCPPSYTLQTDQVVSFDYETDGTIISNQNINAGIMVDYDSGTSIQLNSGFSTSNGSVFEAFIDGCGGSN